MKAEQILSNFSNELRTFKEEVRDMKLDMIRAGIDESVCEQLCDKAHSLFISFINTKALVCHELVANEFNVASARLDGMYAMARANS